MLILAIILFGMLVGAAAQLILGTRGQGINWTTAIVAGLVGSFVGGLLISLLSGTASTSAERHHRVDHRRDPGHPRLELLGGTPADHRLSRATGQRPGRGQAQRCSRYSAGRSAARKMNPPTWSPASSPNANSSVPISTNGEASTGRDPEGHLAHRVVADRARQPAESAQHLVELPVAPRGQRRAGSLLEPRRRRAGPGRTPPTAGPPRGPGRRPRPAARRAPPRPRPSARRRQATEPR